MPFMILKREIQVQTNIKCTILGLIDACLHLVVRFKHYTYSDCRQWQKGDGKEHLSVFVVDAEGDCGGVQEQPRLLLVHLLPETFHATLTLRRFLDTRTQTCRHRLVLTNQYSGKENKVKKCYYWFCVEFTHCFRRNKCVRTTTSSLVPNLFNMTYWNHCVCMCMRVVI